MLPGQEDDPDWARAGPAERLSAAGAAAPAPDVTGIHEDVNAAGTCAFAVPFYLRGDLRVSCIRGIMRVWKPF